jgi:hypothetical protein
VAFVGMLFDVNLKIFFYHLRILLRGRYAGLYCKWRIWMSTTWISTFGTEATVSCPGRRFV